MLILVFMGKELQDYALIQDFGLKVSHNIQNLVYSKPVLRGHLKEDQNCFQDPLLLYVGQKYYRMLQVGSNTFDLH